MDYKITWMGAGSQGMRADFQCNSTEEFLNMPTVLLVDGKMFKKDSFNTVNEIAHYFSEFHIQALTHDKSGTFEIRDYPSSDRNESRVTKVTVE